MPKDDKGKPDVFSPVAIAIKRLREELKNGFEWLKSHASLATKQGLKELKELIVMNQAELVTRINGLTTRLEKVKGEVAKIREALENAGTLNPEVETALAAAEAAVGGVDDINPDEVTPTTEPPVA